MTCFPKKTTLVPTMICLTAGLFGFAPHPLPLQSGIDTNAEEALFRMLNESRRQNGLPPLEREERLAEAARTHSGRMAEAGRLSHQLSGEQTLSSRLAATHLRFSRDAENVAAGPDAEGAHEGFMRSSGHRANILSPLYNCVGIGVVRRGGSIWVTEDFAFRLAHLTDEQVEDEVAASFVRLRKTPPVRRIDAARLRRLACEMAHSGALNTSRVLSQPGVRYAVAYTAAIAADLPQDVRRLRARPDINRFAVGVCFGATRENPGGVYWVLMAFY